MRRPCFRPLLAVSLVVAVLGSLPATAEEVEKKFRIGFSLGQHNSRDNLPSDSANILTVVDENAEWFTQFEDPRNDNAALGQFQMRAADRMSVTGQYAVNRFFLVEASLGYQKGEVGDVEMQAQFSGLQIDLEERYKYTVYNFMAGEIESIPIHLSAIVRFRPKAAFNPYLGIGGGYTLVGFEPSDDLDRVSGIIDSLSGGQTTLMDYLNTVPTFPTEYVGMTGARVEAPSYLEWHVIGGFEYAVKRNWAVYADLRYESANRTFFLGFNGSSSLGISVPARQATLGDPAVTAQYGPWYIPSSGIVDGGLLVNPVSFYSGGQLVEAMPGLCGTVASPTATPVPVSACEFLLISEMSDYNEGYADVEGFVPVSPDGVADPGLYYVRGGSLKYGGATLQIGFRYTF